MNKEMQVSLRAMTKLCRSLWASVDLPYCYNLKGQLGNDEWSVDVTVGVEAST